MGNNTCCSKRGNIAGAEVNTENSDDTPSQKIRHQTYKGESERVAAKPKTPECMYLISLR